MSVFETVVSITGLASSGYSFISGISTSKKLDTLETKIGELGYNFQKLSDSILYVPRAELIKDIRHSVRDAILTNSEIKTILGALQAKVSSPVVSSRLMQTPDRMQGMLSSNPWDVLMDVSRLARVDQGPRKGLIPIVFRFNSETYIGWQTAGIIREIFGIDVIGGDSIWVPASANFRAQEPEPAARPPCTHDPSLHRYTFRHELFLGLGSPDDDSGPPFSEPSPTVAAVFVRELRRKVSRNEPCPCGSGKKFKLCHGRVA